MASFAIRPARIRRPRRGQLIGYGKMIGGRWFDLSELNGLGAQADTPSILQMIRNAAAAAGIPAALALQVATAESSLNPTAVSSKGAIGLFQLMPSTAQQLGVDPYDPQQNAQGGTSYLAQLYQKFGDWATALAAYNWGPGNVEQYGAAAAPASTKNYVVAILGGAGISAAPSSSQASVFTPPGQPAADIIDLLPDGSVPAPAAPGAPNILLLTFLGLAVYFAADLLLGERG